MTTPLIDTAPDTREAAAQRQAEFLDRIRALVPGIRARANEAEALRQMPDATVAELTEAGAFRLHTPLKYGGLQLGLEAHVEMARLLATACVATAWATSFLAHSVTRVTKLPVAMQDRLFSESPDLRSCGTNQPRPGVSLVKQDDGSYLLNGQWMFASGVMNARFVEVSLPNGRNERGAETRIAVMVPRDQVEIVDTWHVSGMSATGSQDIRFNDVVVPETMVHRYEKRNDTDTESSALYPDFPFLRTPYHHVVWAAHAAYVVGAAERAVEIYRTEVAPNKKRPWGTGPAIESPIVHHMYGEAAEMARVARIVMDREVKDVVDTFELSTGGSLSYEQRAYLNMDAVYSIRLAQQAAAQVTRMSGGNIHRKGSELDRILRDLETLLNHSSGDWEFHTEYAGRVLLGLGLGNRAEELF